MGSEEKADDPTLVRLALGGEEVAFSALMSRHKDALYRFVRRYVGDADEALDLVQEAFVAAWAALDRYDAARPFPVWLRRIALNKCRDWSRRRRVRRFFFGATPLQADASASASDERGGDEVVATEARLARLDEAIAELPPALKEPLLLTLFEDLTQQEAARMLGISAKAVETRVYRAKAKLRRLLG